MAGVAPQKSGPVPQELELPGGKSGFRNWLDRKAWRDIIIAMPYVWLVLFFVVPFFIIVAMSLAQSVIAQPPFRYDETWPYVTFDNFARLFSDYVYLRGYLTSLRNALHCNRPLPASRLSHGPGDRPRQGRLAQHPAAPRHPAVLDLIPAARLCLDRHDGQQQLVQPRAHLTSSTCSCPPLRKSIQSR